MHAKLTTVTTVALASLLMAGAGVGACSPQTPTFVSAGGTGGSDGGGFGGAGGFGGGFGGGEASDAGDAGGGLTPAFVNGTRLHAYVQDATGGAIALVNWQDTSLNLSCTFAPTSDGNVHCVPVSSNAIAYSDAACTTKVAVLGACGALSSYVVESSATAACRQNPLDQLAAPAATTYTVGAKLGTGVIYTLNNNSPPTCAVSSMMEDYYAITVADPTQFVSATVVKQARDSRLDVDVVEGSDGSRQLSGAVYDHSMGEAPCGLAIAGTPTNPTFLCVPGAMANAQGSNPEYDNATCTTVVASEPDYAACGAATVVAETAAGSTCGFGTETFYQVGTDVTAGNVCAPAATAPCSCHTDTSGTHYYTLGATIAPTTFAGLTAAKFGSARLQTVYLADATGVQLAGAEPNSLYDTTAGASCQLWTFSDMSMRCVSENDITTYTGNPLYYSDAMCTKQLVVQYVNPGCAAATPTAMITIQQSTGACGTDTVTAANSVGAQFSGATVYQLYNGTCQSQVVGSGQVYYAVGATLDFSTFAAVTDHAD